MIVQKPEAQISVVEHLDILRDVEKKVIEKLAELHKSYVPIGTRVLYFVAGEDGSPAGEGHRLDCGDLSLVDAADVIYVDEEQWRAIQESEKDSFVLPLEFVDKLYEMAKDRLESSAECKLLVEVAGVLTGSSTTYGTGCTCAGPKRKHYAGSKAYCTSESC